MRDLLRSQLAALRSAQQGGSGGAEESVVRLFGRHFGADLEEEDRAAEEGSLLFLCEP